MSKKSFLTLFFLILFSSLSVYSQQVTNQPKALNVQDDIQFRVLYQFQQQAKKYNEEVFLKDTMALNIGANMSEYYDWHKTKLDSLKGLVSTYFEVLFIKENDEELNARLEAGEEAFKVAPRAAETSRIYKDRINGTLTTFDDGPDVGRAPAYLMLKEDISPMNWTITNDTATVLNYMCRKATTTFRGRNYSAWFTSEIPVNDGPWKLYGLPGLILKAETTDGIFHFTAIGIENVKNQTIAFPNDRKVVEAKNLTQLYKFRYNKWRKIDIILAKNKAATAYMTKNPVVKEDLELEKE